MVASTALPCHNHCMRERDYPKFASSPRGYLPPDQYARTPDVIFSPNALAERLTEIDQVHAADIRAAIEEAATIQSDVHIYRKRGSQFLGVAFMPATGPSVRVYEYPEIRS